MADLSELLRCSQIGSPHLVGASLYLVFEAWLGRRMPFGAGSTLALIMKPFGWIITRTIVGGSMEIAQGASGDVKYDVSISGGKLVAVASDEKLGVKDTFELNGKLVVDALMDAVAAKFPGEAQLIGFFKSIADQAIVSQS